MVMRDWDGYHAERWGIEALLLLVAEEGGDSAEFRRRMEEAGFNAAIARAATFDAIYHKTIECRVEHFDDTFTYGTTSYRKGHSSYALTDLGRTKLEEMRAGRRRT